MHKREEMRGYKEIYAVTTNQHLPLPTTQTTTATPRIAHLFVCVLAADNLAVLHTFKPTYRKISRQ
ncbi:MAG: hypothetical protein IPK94_10415 [Saprospiraceae bacterium]|nr:hypothetical protein [Saprospiraceae bacterium]